MIKYLPRQQQPSFLREVNLLEKHSVPYLKDDGQTTNLAEIGLGARDLVQGP